MISRRDRIRIIVVRRGYSLCFHVMSSKYIQPEGMLTVVEEVAYSLPDQQTGESNGMTREKPETRSHSENRSK